ncbi:hypothetical protein BT69DRAFT_611229 [Atractiella rhizophila]|nr:hypothetical protein BT69DRAFT_611229 [Atractiella rhizophila]
MTKRKTKKTPTERASTPPPTTPDSTQNTKPEYQQGPTPRKLPPNFKPLQRNLQLGERLKSESPVVVLEDLRPNIGVEIELSAELTAYNAADWKDENSIKTWMDKLYRYVREEKSRYDNVDRQIQLSENPTNRDSAKADGVLIHHEIDPPVVAYSNVSLSFEFKDQAQSAASEGNTQLARNSAYILGARPRCFIWNVLIDKAGDKHFSWSKCMRGGHFRGKPKRLEDHFKEFAQTIAKFAKASEEQIGFLNIFDHDPAWHFTWEVGSSSRTEGPASTNRPSASSSRASSPNISLPSAEPSSASTTTPWSTMLLPSQFVPNPNHKFKLDLNGCLKGWDVVGKRSEFKVNWVQEILFRSYSVAGSGTQVWMCELEGGGYGVIKHVWLTKVLLERLKEHVKQFDVWRDLWKDQPPLRHDGSPAEAVDLTWLRHAPRLILSQPNLSTRKILSKNALWNGGDVSEVMETDLIPVLTYHSTVS